MKILKRKTFGMMVAVFGLRYIFSKERGWQVTIYAGGNRVVAGFLPWVKLRLHDMTVHACIGVFAKIGEPFCVFKRKRPNAQTDSDHHANKQKNISWFQGNGFLWCRDFWNSVKLRFITVAYFVTDRMNQRLARSILFLEKNDQWNKVKLAFFS